MRWDNKLTITPVHLSSEMLDFMEEDCKERGYTYRRMPSGAGHDSLEIGQSIPTVMIFTPSKVEAQKPLPGRVYQIQRVRKGIRHHEGSCKALSGEIIMHDWRGRQYFYCTAAPLLCYNIQVIVWE